MGDFKTDLFQLINDPPRFYNEFHALNHYLATLENDIEIIRFQSSFTAMGQLYFAQFPIDGFLAFKKKDKQRENIYSPYSIPISISSWSYKLLFDTK
jgi:hypothetical protein